MCYPSEELERKKNYLRREHYLLFILPSLLRGEVSELFVKGSGWPVGLPRPSQKHSPETITIRF